METKVISRNVLGIKLDEVLDIIKFSALGGDFGICDEDGNTFTGYMVDIDEDGETEREPTEKEILDRAIRGFDEGRTLYATVYIGCANLVPKAATTLQSEFYVGQDVYTMLDNRIARGEIQHLTLAKGLSPTETYVDYKADGLAQRICNRIIYEYFPASTKNYYKLKCKDDIENDVRNTVNGAQVVLKIGSRMYTRSLSEIFATKDALVKDLMG